MAFTKNQWVELSLAQHIDLKQCISYSGLKYLERSPQHYLNRNKKEPTAQARKNMDFGSAIDHAIFTPADFDRLVVTCPEDYLASNGAMSTKLAKQWKAEQDKEALILKAEEKQKVRDMVKVLTGRRSVMKILRKGYAQKSGVFKLPDVVGDNVWAKIRPDWISAAFGQDELAVVDYKSTEDASFNTFQMQIYNMRYHWQAALYCMGATAITGVVHKNFYWIVQERNAPFEVAVYKADSDMLSLARRQMFPLLKLWGQLQAGSADWKRGYPDIIQPMPLPYWASAKVEKELERQELVDQLEREAH